MLAGCQSALRDVPIGGGSRAAREPPLARRERSAGRGHADVDARLGAAAGRGRDAVDVAHRALVRVDGVAADLVGAAVVEVAAALQLRVVVGGVATASGLDHRWLLSERGASCGTIRRLPHAVIMTG